MNEFRDGQWHDFMVVYSGATCGGANHLRWGQLVEGDAAKRLWAMRRPAQPFAPQWFPFNPVFRRSLLGSWVDGDLRLD